MANLLLVRHGQASLGATDYDQLSSIGAEQARLLGEHFSSLNFTPTRLVSGTLNRHKQTLTEISSALLNAQNLDEHSQLHEDAAWNEFEFKSLIKQYLKKNPSEEKHELASKPAYFFGLLKKAMLDWSVTSGTNDCSESWVDFEQRVSNSLKQIHRTASKNDNIVLVSSGGAISMALKWVLNLNAGQMIDINFQIRNSSITHLELKKDRIVLAGFNQLPHLETASNKHLITYV